MDPGSWGLQQGLPYSLEVLPQAALVAGSGLPLQIQSLVFKWTASRSMAAWPANRAAHLPAFR